MDMDFKKIDFNACPEGTGNPGPNYLAGIDKCRKDTTVCKQRSSYHRGFVEGAYECECKPGYRYPRYIKPPFQGKLLQYATYTEYKKGFDCIPIEHSQVLPAEIEGESIEYSDLSSLYDMGSNDFESIKKTIAKRSIKNAASNATRKTVVDVPGLDEQQQVKRSSRRRRRGAGYDPEAFRGMLKIFYQYSIVTKKTCKQRPSQDLVLPGDVTYGVEKQFEFEARTALRLSHFLSNFLQNVDGKERYGNMMGGGYLHIDHMFGEVIANVMSNYKIYSSGVYFDENTYKTEDGTIRQLFGPLAYRKYKEIYALDTAGLKHRYSQEDWFLNIKQRWVTNTDNLKEYKMKPKVRSDINGTSSVKFEFYPIKYYAPSLSDGQWSQPIFRCDGRIDKWVMMYSVPFFGKEGKKKVAFKGVVTVDVPLNLLKINQCPMPYYVANAFKNTAKCHQPSTTCRPLDEFPWTHGAYRCDCRQGHEYYFMDGKTWFEGSLVELEWLKKQHGLVNRFDSLYCRVSGVPTHIPSCLSIILSLLLILCG